MRAIYNGVDMMPLETFLFDCVPIYDPSSTDYLYTMVQAYFHLVINGGVTVVNQTINPATGVPPNGPPISYKFADSKQDTELRTSGGGGSLGLRTPITPDDTASGPLSNPNILPGSGLDQQTPSVLRGIKIVPNPAPLTHQVIRHRLCTPGGQLYVFDGPGMESGTPAAGKFDPPLGNLILRSPALDDSGEPMPTDCKNGPFPKLLSITKAMGDSNLFEADWGVETYINEAELNNVKPCGSVLSNRFSQTHRVSLEGYTVITTTGLMIVRTDLVYTFPESPDFNRAFAFQPIPQGFMREIDYVHGREDVSGIEYQYHDIQVPVNFPAGPYVQAASIEVLHRQAITSNVDLLGGALSAYERILGIRTNRAIIGDAARRRAGDIPWKRAPAKVPKVPPP